MSGSSTQKPFQRIVIVVSGLAFLGTMTLASFSFLRSPSHQQANSGNYPTADEQLQSVIEGYEKVLEREPDNPTAKHGLEQALRTLTATQIQAQNLDQAIPPMEKLVKLVPDNTEYQSVLAQMKQAQKYAPPSETEQVPLDPNLQADPPVNNSNPNSDPLNLSPEPTPNPLNLNPESNSNPFNLNSIPNSDPSNLNSEPNSNP
ncbi:MAG: tetratricopeptide repeat protein [Cyanobacteria bacterium P01_G01_bin.49]